MYYLVCPIGAVAGPSDMLTYSADAPLTIGAIVQVPFGSRTKIGVVMNKAKKPEFATKPITSTTDVQVPSYLLELAQWISEYYATRLPIVLQTILPSGLTKKRRAGAPELLAVSRQPQTRPLTPDQIKALETIRRSNHVTHLLHGVTGSGKTRVYQELAREVLQQDRSVLILVPEISLTPQLLAEFQSLHNSVIVIHSRLTEAQRHSIWQQLGSSSEPHIIIGPRSALFAPLKNLGLIVIDEAHEPSYQQDSSPKYNALRVARKLAELNPGKPKLILGSATPLVQDYYIATETSTPIITMSTPTTKRQTAIELVDLADNSQFGTNRLFSKKLLDAMHNALVQNEQILLFHNRRGSARINLCADCGWVAECHNCHLPLRLHQDRGLLLCHICGHTERPPKVCPTCSGTDIVFKGFGSKRIETEVAKLFPEVTLARFDSDTEAADQLHNRYQELYDNKVSIIIGTQGIAKGLDLPHLSTVGIVQADSELFIPDFASTERAFQLTTQVIGRAGRAGQRSTVIIQALNPEHPALQFAASQSYNDFYQYELSERKAEHMPPHTHLLQLTIGYASSQSATQAARNLKQSLTQTYPDIFVRGPAPAFHEHRGNQYYQQLIVSSSIRGTLVAITKSLPQRWRFTLDPINLLA